jgi:hypothetical protein
MLRISYDTWKVSYVEQLLSLRFPSHPHAITFSPFRVVVVVVVKVSVSIESLNAPLVIAEARASSA